MHFSDWVLALCTVLGPILAVQAQKISERLQERRQNRMLIFRILMANRRSRNAEYVQALNLIEIYFDGRKYKDIRDAWAAYLDFFCDPNSAARSNEDFKQHQDRDTALLVDLLTKMSRSLGYDFNTVQLAKGAYWPQGHLDDVVERNIIRSSLARMLGGQSSVPMAVTSFPVDVEAAGKVATVQDALLDVLKGDKPVKIEGLRLTDPVCTGPFSSMVSMCRTSAVCA